MSLRVINSLAHVRARLGGRAEVDPKRKKRGEALVEDALERADKQTWYKCAKQSISDVDKSDKICCKMMSL